MVANPGAIAEIDWIGQLPNLSRVSSVVSIQTLLLLV